MNIESAEAMRPEPRVEHVQTTDYFYHVRIRPQEAFEELRTPIEAAETAWELIGEGCDVREGRLPSGTWLLESVLIPRERVDDEAHAEALTRQLVAVLEG
jgi:hypothetical protein